MVGDDVPRFSVPQAASGAAYFENRPLADHIHAGVAFVLQNAENGGRTPNPVTAGNIVGMIASRRLVLAGRGDASAEQLSRDSGGVNPKGFEYSVKDDKIRIVATGCKFKQFNLGRVVSCDFYNGNGPWNEKPKAERRKNLTLLITDERNALERAMLHFAHFEKQAERTDDGRYILRLKYYENDETEIVIRVLSFGPYVKVLEPESFVNLIKERLISQKSCELK